MKNRILLLSSLLVVFCLVDPYLQLKEAVVVVKSTVKSGWQKQQQQQQQRNIQIFATLLPTLTDNFRQSGLISSKV